MIEELNIGNKDIDFDLAAFEVGFKNRYTKAKVSRDLPSYKIRYENAKKLAAELKIEDGTRYDCIVAGNFIFGDFIEAFVTHNNSKCARLTISTLSMDQNNVDSLKNLIDGQYVDELNLIISDYF